MPEIIESIEEHNDKDGEGYHVTTSKRDIIFVISAGQCCCEDSGYVSSEDDFSDYIGGEIISIEETDINRMKKDVLPIHYDGGGVMFIDFNTSKGTLQFAVYNAHNGYYGHNIKFLIKDRQTGKELLHTDCL